MRISAESDYACRALLELALNWPDRKPAQVAVIAAKQAIPVKYLEQILIQFKSAGIVESVRGKQGGYRLAKAPREISLGEVMRRLKGPLVQLADSASREESVFTAVWQEVEGAIVRVLDKITFAEIADKAKSTDNVTSYQI